MIHRRSCLVGLTSTTTLEDIVITMLGGNAFSLADGAAALASARTMPAQLGLIGGGARSDSRAGLMANVFGFGLVHHQDARHGPAFNAAWLAITGEYAGAVAVTPTIDCVFEPDFRIKAAHAPRLQAFRSLYRALAPDFC